MPCLHCYCRSGFHPDEADALVRFLECHKCGHREAPKPKAVARGAAGGVLDSPEDDGADRQERYAAAEAEGKDLKGEEIL